MGLTGSVASGKTAVADVWREEGVPVVSADELAREVVEPGSPALEEIREEFGDEVVSDGSLDRAALRERVFGDAEARRRLEEILHPRIAELRDRWMEQRRREGAELVAAEIPLLYEVGLEDDVDVVVVVDAPEDVRLHRMRRHRDLDEEEARSIMEAQMDPPLKREKADYVVENSGTLEELERRARSLLAELRERADGGAS